MVQYTLYIQITDKDNENKTDEHLVELSTSEQVINLINYIFKLKELNI